MIGRWLNRRHRSAMGRRDTHRRGFALLEALVAMAIASIALATLYRSVGQGSKNVVEVEARVEAALLAKSVLAEATFAEDLARLAAGRSGPWRWVVSTAPEQVQVLQESSLPAGPALSAARVTVEVFRGEGSTPVSTWTTWKPWRSTP